MARDETVSSGVNQALRLIVHIGPHKSGSTSIQRVALQSKSALQSIGILYPARCAFFKHDQHSQLAIQIQRGEWRRVEDFLERAATEANRVSAGAVFLSGEEFWPLSGRKVARFASIASKFFGEKSIAYVTRNPVDRLYSNFKHFLRHSPFRTVDEFVKETSRIFLPGGDLWKENFSNIFIEMDFDDDNLELVPEFFKKVLGLDISENPYDNISLDIMSLVINNIFLKDWPGQETEDALWSFVQKHSNGNRFPIEAAIRNQLVRNVFGTEKDLLQKAEELPPPDYDPVAVCDRMIDLFTALRGGFASRGQAEIQTSNAE